MYVLIDAHGRGVQAWLIKHHLRSISIRMGAYRKRVHHPSSVVAGDARGGGVSSEHHNVKMPIVDDNVGIFSIWVAKPLLCDYIIQIPLGRVCRIHHTPMP